MRPALLLGAGFALLQACGGGGSLDGSVDESYDLTFDFHRIRKQADTLIVEYIRVIGGGENKVLKLTLEGHKLVVSEGGDVFKIDIAPGLRVDGGLFLQAVTLNRVSGRGTVEFPAVKQGDLNLGAMEFLSGGQASGSFSVVFENGRTLSGSFSGVIEEIDLS